MNFEIKVSLLCIPTITVYRNIHVTIENKHSSFLAYHQVYLNIRIHCANIFYKPTYVSSDTYFLLYQTNVIKLTCLTLQLPSYLIGISTHLMLCLSDAIHNFKWVNIIQSWGQRFWNRADWQLVFNVPSNYWNNNESYRDRGLKD